MLIGIVQFERFGGDPLKRRVTVQVSHSKSLKRPNQKKSQFSKFQLLITFILNNLLFTSSTVQNVFDLNDLGFFKNLRAFCMYQYHFYALLTIFQIGFIKFWLKHIRKRLVAMDEAFIVTCITLQNVMMSVLYALTKMAIEDHENTVSLMSVKETHLNENVNLDDVQ